jgi:hypothetical protein
MPARPTGELRNPRINAHPYQPLLMDDPNLFEVLELELQGDLFAPGAQSFGLLATDRKLNLTRDTEELMENFLALVECASRLCAKCPSTTIRQVELAYIAIMTPEMYAKMMSLPRAQRSPANMYEKNFSSHVLRATVRHSEVPNQPWSHTFANLQKAVNSQAARLKFREDKLQGKASKPRKKPRRQREEKGSDDDGSQAEEGEEEDNDEEEQQPETMESKWRRYAEFGVWERGLLPVFENPKPRGVSAAPVVRYTYVHEATENSYKQMVDKLFHADRAELHDISDPRSSYNPVNVFSPRGNFLRRQTRLMRHPLYADVGRRYDHRPARGEDTVERRLSRQKRAKRSVQQEARGDLCIASDALGLTLPGESDGAPRQLRSNGVRGYPVGYGGQLCWLLDTEDFTAATWRHRKFPWASRASEDDLREQRAYVRSAPSIDPGIPAFLLPDTVSSPAELLSAGERALMGRVLQDRAGLESLYQRQVNMVSTTGNGAMTMRRWGTDNILRGKRMGEELARKFPGDAWKTDRALGERYVAYKRELLVLAQQDCIDEFAAKVHSVETTASMARRSIAKWYNDGVSKAQDAGHEFIMSFPHDKKHNNLSVFGDAMAREIEELEGLCFVAENHDIIMAKLLAALQVHVPFKTVDGREVCGIHVSFILQSVQGSTGKSFAEKVAMLHLIIGSYLANTRITPQFLTGSDAPPDEHGYIQLYHKILFFQDEMQDGMLEYKEEGQAGRVFTMQSPLADMIRTVQTRGEYMWLGPILDNGKGAGGPQTSWRQNGQINVHCECLINCCTNSDLAKFAHNGLSRNVVCRFKQAADDGEEDSTRPDTSAKMAAAARMSLVTIERRRRRFQRWHRNQFIASIDGQLVEGAVPGYEPIDTACARQFHHWVKRSAKRLGLAGFDQPRNLDIFVSLCQGAVLFEACHRMFDVVGAPFAKRPFTFRDMLWMQKHRVATLEHAVFAFGIMRGTFEDNDVLLTNKLVYEWAYDTHVKHNERLRARPANGDGGGLIVLPRYMPGVVVAADPDVFERRANAIVREESGGITTHHMEWRVKNCSALAQGGSASSSAEHLAKQLAVALATYKSDLPWASGLTEGAIAAALTRMLHTKTTVPLWASSRRSGFVRMRHGVYRKAQLQLAGRDVVLASWEADVDAERARVMGMQTNLLTAIQGVLQHAHCRTPRDFLYGASCPGLPHLFDYVVCGVGAANAPQLTVMNADSVEEPLLEEVDDYFIAQFNAKINVGPYVLRAYPSNHPVELMRQVFLFQVPYDIRPPYPVHDSLFFLTEYRTRRKLSQQRTARQRHQRRLMAQDAVSVESSLLIREREQAQVVLENATSLARQASELSSVVGSRAGLTPRLVALLDREPPPNTLERWAVMWLRMWNADVAPIHLLLVELANPKRKPPRKRNNDRSDAWPLPPALQHPLTTLEVKSSPETAMAMKSFMTQYSSSVKTHSDVTVDREQAKVVIDGDVYRVRAGGLQLDSAQDEFAQERHEMEMMLLEPPQTPPRAGVGGYIEEEGEDDEKEMLDLSLQLGVRGQ